jgi:23S rRNA (guanosine2251-2'-O)-methyltransferase
MSKQEEHRIVIGLQPVREALRVHQGRMVQVFVQRDTPRLEGVEKLASASNVPVRFVTRAELDQRFTGAQHQGVAAFAPPLELLDWNKVSDASLLIALDGIVDPQNFGAVIRSAVGVAGAAVVWGENASAPLTPATFRASAGAIEHARLCRVQSLVSTLRDAAAAGMAVVGLDGHADRALHELDLSGPTVIVVGSEGKGMGRATRKACTAVARLNMTGSVDSLNASVAAALALYEAGRQRA